MIAGDDNHLEAANREARLLKKRHQCNINVAVVEKEGAGLVNVDLQANRLAKAPHISIAGRAWEKGHYAVF